MLITNIFFKIKELLENNPAKRNRIIMVPIWLAFFLVVVSAGLIPIFFWQTKELVILKYNVYFGISSLGHWYQLWLMTACGFLFLAINYFLAFKFYLRYRVLSYFLVFSALVANLILLASLLLIIYINS